MKKMFGITLLMLPVLAASAQASGWPFNVQAGGSFYIKGGPCRTPQAGPWYLYWPLEAHFVAPAPTGYPYWPGPQVLPGMAFGGPAYPPPAAPVPPAVVPVPAPAAPAPAPVPAPTPAAPPAGPALSLPPYLQPTSYAPVAHTAPAAGSYAVPSTGAAPSYWYDR